MKTNQFISGVTFALLAAMSCATAKKEVKATSTVEEGPVEPAPAGTPSAPAAPAAPVALEPQTLPDGDFKTFEPPGEGFSVKIPTNAKAERPKDDSGKEVSSVWSVNGPIGQYMFVFARQAMSAKARAKMGSNEEIFNQYRSMLTQAVQGTVKNKAQMKYKGADAEDFVITGTMKQVLGRVVIADNAVYNLFVFYDATPPAYSKAYLDSLEFTAPAPTVAPTVPVTPPPGPTPPPPPKTGRVK